MPNAKKILSEDLSHFGEYDKRVFSALFWEGA